MLAFRKERGCGFGSPWVAQHFGASNTAAGDDGLGQSELRAVGPSGEEDGEGNLSLHSQRITYGLVFQVSEVLRAV